MQDTEAVVWRCSVKKLFLEISQNSQENSDWRNQIFEKKKKIWQPRPKTRFFCRFLKFCWLVFLEIAYNDSLQQLITSSRDVIDKKTLGTKFGQERAKIGPKTRFSAIFSILVH